MMEQIHCSSYAGFFYTNNEWVLYPCTHRRHCRWQGYTVNEEDVSHTHTLGLAQLLHTITKNTNTYKILGVYRHATQRPIQRPKTYDIIFFLRDTVFSIQQHQQCGTNIISTNVRLLLPFLFYSLYVSYHIEIANGVYILNG